MAESDWLDRSHLSGRPCEFQHLDPSGPRETGVHMIDMMPGKTSTFEVGWLDKSRLTDLDRIPA